MTQGAERAFGRVRATPFATGLHQGELQSRQLGCCDIVDAGAMLDASIRAPLPDSTPLRELYVPCIDGVVVGQWVHSFYQLT